MFDSVKFVNDLLDKRISAFLSLHPDRENAPEVVGMRELQHEINIALEEYKENDGKGNQ